MKAIVHALERLSAAGRAPMGGDLGNPIDAEVVLSPLMSTVEHMKAVSKREPRPSRSLFEEARRSWRASGGRLEDLSTRQIRALCWDVETATDPRFLGRIEHHPDLPRNRRWLEGLIESYFSSWRSMRDPARIEAVLRRSVSEFAGRGDRLLRYKPVTGHLFSERAAEWLAQQVVSQQVPIIACLDDWRVESASGLARETANVAVDVWLARFEHHRSSLAGEDAITAFRQLARELLVSEFVRPAQCAKAISTLILWQHTELNPRLQKELKDYLLAHPQFRDPRLPRRGTNWDLCAPEAKQRFTGWLAKNDLLFFFKSVIQHDPHGRRDFWLRYIERAVDANVALSDLDVDRLRSHTSEKLSYSLASGGQGTSAFIMRFKESGRDIICIEFSLVGNALYIHDSEKFIKKWGGIRRSDYHVANGLKSRGTFIAKFNHSRNWQWDLQQFLAREGIRPK